MEHFHKIICVFAQRGHAKGSEIKGKLMTLNIQNNTKMRQKILSMIGREYNILSKYFRNKCKQFKMNDSRELSHDTKTVKHWHRRYA